MRHEAGGPRRHQAIIWPEILTTAALVVALVVVNVWRPGAGANIDQALDAMP
jgi:Na+/H+-dicarboxylate symporter